MALAVQGMTSVAADAVIPADPLDDVPADAVVAVAMSGGVDSSVAALRCVERGLQAWGVTLAMWKGTNEQVRDRGCCSIDSVDDARRVCATLGIPHYTWNLEAEFEDAVIAEFEDEYASGRTPNPCVRCNERIKFGVLLERTLAAGATHVATGHYAQRGRRGQTWTLHRSRDAEKDQSYTLHRLNQEQLRHAVFPLGAMDDKQHTREAARARGLVTAEKKESQDLCFVEGSVRQDLQLRLVGRFTPGDIVNTEGTVIGSHRGLPFYTVGQRNGLAINPSEPDADAWYVLRLEANTNTVVVGRREELSTSRLRADQVSWIDGLGPKPGSLVQAQVRAHGQANPGRLASVEPGALTVDFAEPIGLVAPGQPVVIAADGEILGGGIVAADY